MKLSIAKYGLEQVLIYVYALLFLVGMLGYAIPALKPIIHETTEVFLFVTSLPVLFILYRLQEKKMRYVVIVALIIVITLIIEIVGVRTGAIFGNYVYGKTLRFKILEVPVIIGINWCVLIIAAHTISSKLPFNRYAVITFSSILIVLFDILLEPIAVELDYWNWLNGQIPLQNYMAWFIISWLAGLVLKLADIRLSGKLVASYFIYQIILFGWLHWVL